MNKIWALQVVLVIKNPPANTGDRHGFHSWVGKILWRGGHGNPLQYSCLDNPRDRETWRATVHRVTKSWTLLKT